jgi:RecJ-like exonuclease
MTKEVTEGNYGMSVETEHIHQLHEAEADIAKGIQQAVRSIKPVMVRWKRLGSRSEIALSRIMKEISDQLK